jgi:hypothetical protein
VSSVRFGGCLFRLYPQDHTPRHVHGAYGSAEVVVDLRADGTVDLADRADRIQPKNAKVSDVRKILHAAAEHFDELVALWEKMHP